MDTERKIGLMIVDDHEMFLQGLVEMIKTEQHLSVLNTANDGKKCIDLLKFEQPDILITDIRMNEIDGYDLSLYVKENHPDVKVLVVTMHNEPQIINKFLKAGIMGYILKNTGKEELLHAINTIYGGNTFFSPEVQEIYMNSLVHHKHKKEPEHITLTSREKEIVKLIAEEYTTNEIAEKLFISLNTVETHRKNILRKLKVRNSVGIVKKSIELKLIEEWVIKQP